MPNSILTNKRIARQGNSILTSYYEKAREN